MLDELKRLSVEVVAFVAALPPQFVAQKSSYLAYASQILELGSHTLSHIDQINGAIAAARK